MLLFSCPYTFPHFDYKRAWLAYLHKSFVVQYIHASIRTSSGEKVYVRSPTHGNLKKSINIGGYEDGLDLKLISGRLEKRFADLSLHEVDLNICVEILETLSKERFTFDHPLAEAAIVAVTARFFKCFGASAARNSLNANKIYRDVQNGMRVFEYFKSVRDKHVIHDENPMAQAVTGLVINRPGAAVKVADVIAFPAVAKLADQNHFQQLWNLVFIAREWVAKQIEELAKLITAEYEKRSHEDLMKLPGVSVYKHGSEMVGKNRNTLSK